VHGQVPRAYTDSWLYGAVLSAAMRWRNERIKMVMSARNHAAGVVQKRQARSVTSTLFGG